jgi:DNA polymerase-3 subunit delta'
MNSLLEKIPGQQRVKKILENFLCSGNIPHAFLFTGIEGIGKHLTAIKFAQALVTTKKENNLNKKISGIEQLSEPYLKFIFALPRGKNETDSDSPTEKLNIDDLEQVREQIEKKGKNPFHKIFIPKSNFIKINSIRDIKKFLSRDYKEIGYRFVLISDAHLMNEESQNALLKNLEEPPPEVIFILTTSVISKLRSTIISRCCRINFDPLSEDEIIYILKTYFEIKEETANVVVPFAMGSVQTAINLIDMDIHNLTDKTISLLRYSFGRKFNSAFEELNSILSEQSSSAFPILVNMIIAWLNDLQKHRLNFKKYYYTNHIDTLEKFNNKFPNVKLNELTSILDKLSSLQVNNINPTLLSSNLIFELTSVVQQKQ